jgi:HSP20 family protein
MAFRGSGGLVPFFGGGFTPLFSLRREIDRVFEDAFGGRSGGATWAPAVDVCEEKDEIRLDVDLPGIKPENVDINVENGLLTIRGEKRDERKEGEEGRYHMIERSYGSFFRSFTLPQGVSEEQISADFEHGVLHIRIPKAALPQPRRIQISGARQEQTAGETQGRRQVSGRGAQRDRSRSEDQSERMVAEERKE